MRVSHIRKTTNDFLHYRLALLLHCRYSLDAAMSEVDLTTLSRPEAREHILAIERTTGLSTGALIHDCQLED